MSINGNHDHKASNYRTVARGTLVGVASGMNVAVDTTMRGRVGASQDYEGLEIDLIYNIIT
jgi:hypothetical protein